ncbi:MAG TPA: CHAT domain-containing protein [Bacteroidales bacterium]|nr:CHAT domain-containing protein [Bacteroidales bacterium]HSA43104.1 CHAT domain-containing protein [Bacteroidales bacterium]
MFWIWLEFFLMLLVHAGEHRLQARLAEENSRRQPTASQLAYKAGYQYYLDDKYDSANLSFGNARALYLAEGKTDSAMRSHLYLAEIAAYQGLLEQAECILREVQQAYPGLMNRNCVFFSDYNRAWAQVYQKRNQYDSAHRCLNRAIGVLQLHKQAYDSAFFLPYYYKAMLFKNENQFDSALYYSDLTHESLITGRKKSLRNHAQTYYLFFDIYLNRNKLSKAHYYIDLALSVTKSQPKLDTAYFAGLLFAKVFLFNKVAKYDSVFFYTSRIINYLNTVKLKKENRSLLVTTLYLNADICLQIGDAHRGKEYAEQVVQLAGDPDNPIPSHLSMAVKIIGIYYYRTGQYEQSISKYHEAIEIAKKYHIDYGSVFTDLASNIFSLKDTALAESYYLKAIETIQKEPLREKREPFSRLAYGVFLYLCKRTEEGRLQLEQALALNRKLYGERNYETSKCYFWLGNCYLTASQPEKALRCYQKSMISLRHDFNDTSIFSMPSLNFRFDRREFSSILRNKARAFDTLYHRYPERLDYLSTALKHYDQCVAMIHRQRTSFPELTSKLTVADNEKSTYQEAMGVATRMFSVTKSEAYREKAFEYAEKGRAAILLTALKEKQAMIFGGVPDSLIRKEEALAESIESFTRMIAEEKQLSIPNKDRLKELENKLFVFQSTQNELIDRYERMYPQYYALKYDDRVICTADIRKKLNEGIALLEYSITPATIYIFVLSRERFELVTLPRPEGFGKALEVTGAYLREMDFFGQSREEYAAYLEASHALYRALIAPVAGLVRGKDLVIIPDEDIGNLPFEVLLTRRADPGQEYATLPFMLKEQAIGYAYSANLYFFSPRRSIPDNLKLAAFSPEYDETAGRGIRRDPVLKPLLYAVKESKAACDYFNGRLFTGKKASEEHFKKVAGRYDVLHLAMHALVDDENPMHSKLAFTRISDSEEDGFLNTYEIFNLKLKARMAVLSACKTGAGKVHRGEGIMSLARGFYYAGCPDVVMTLWPVEDEMSTLLITYFYENLDQGMNKLEALRQAKLKLIRSSDPLRAHPYFWAAYVNIGEITPMVKEKNRKPTILLWALIGGLGLVLLVPMVWKKLRQN